MKVYVTKYALTSGIETVSASGTNIPGTVLAEGGMGEICGHLHGKEWHKTPEAALARAEEMRTAKLASIAKQKAKLEAMTFTIPEE